MNEDRLAKVFDMKQEGKRPIGRPHIKMGKEGRNNTQI
jgi:hypothetical protein